MYRKKYLLKIKYLKVTKNCHLSCLTCLNEAWDGCTSCDPLNFRETAAWNEQTCGCMENYFDNGINS